MPRYSKETTAALKRVLMCRRDKGYRFNEGDLPGLTQETGLNRTDIIRWAHHVRDYYNTPEDMEKYFSQNGVDKNHNINYCHVMSWNTDLDIVKKMWETEQFNHIEYSLSEKFGTAELFLDFRMRTRTNALKLQMEDLGCSEVIVTPFDAGSALYRVQKSGEREGNKPGFFGVRQLKIMDAAKLKRNEDEKQAKEDRAEETAKMAAAVKASMGDLNRKQDMLVEGQASIKEGVAQMGEQMHNDMCDLEKRFKETQQALQQSQKAEAETKKSLQQSQTSLQTTQQHLTEEQDKNKKQRKAISILNQKNEDAENAIKSLKRAKSSLETENAQLKTKLNNLQSLQTLQEDVRSLRTNMNMLSEQVTSKTMQISEQITNSFNAQDNKQDDILAAVKSIKAIENDDDGFKMEGWDEVVYPSDEENDGVGSKRGRSEDDSD